MTTKRPVAGNELAQATESDSKPIVSPPLPLLTRFQLAVQVWAVQTFVVVGVWIREIWLVQICRKDVPDYIKRYPVRPSLRSRVFLPKNYEKSQKLPLYIDIHGGGFVIANPSTDDHFCRPFADRFGYCVVSIDYRKAPSHPFPVPTHDCVELVRAVLSDKDLPIDHDKVVVGGFSAGGNLSLGVAQFDDLKDRIKAVVPIYPVVDFTGKYPREYKVTKDDKEDILKSASKMFGWAYLPLGIDRRHRLLSCIYATREMLPQKMYIVGAEYDCLCNEAQMFAKKLAGVNEDINMGPDWHKNGIRWEMVPDRQHGFTHITASKGKPETERQQVCDELYERIATWLKEEVFQK